MNCPKCGKKLKTKQTYQAGGTATSHRLECICGTIVTTLTTIVNVNPNFGEGAKAVAQKILKAKPQPRS